MIYGYIRVSTTQQNIDRQYEKVKALNVDDKNIYVDKVSGKDFDRTNYQKLIRKIKKGDLLIISSIDRLGRNYQMILEEWALITKKKEADICVLDMPLLDTRKKDGDLTSTLISDIVLQLLSYVAQKEREFIKQRQAEGIAIAKAKGVKFGRPKKPLTNADMVIQRWQNYEIKPEQAWTELGLSKSSFYKLVKGFGLKRDPNKKPFDYDDYKRKKRKGFKMSKEEFVKLMKERREQNNE